VAQLVALLGAIAGLFWAINSMQKSGVSLNPFAWMRRLKWQKEFGTKPLYRLRDPSEVAAVLLLGIAKCKGDLTATQKAKVRDVFIRVLKLPEAEADDLMVAAMFMVRDEVYIVDNLARILANTRRTLSTAQKTSVLNLMEDVAAVDGPANAEQRRLIDQTVEILNRRD
jgi:uncharacterized tellurite resistance protein B-like protein